MAPPGPYSTRPSYTKLFAKNSLGRYEWGSSRPTPVNSPVCAPGATVTVRSPDRTRSVWSG